MYITRQIYDAAESLRSSGDIAGMYQLLADNGDRYAELALGVFNYDTLAGISATEFMKNEALDGGVSIDEAKMLEIKQEMASQYSIYLSDRLDAIELNNGVAIDTQISADETKVFHTIAFEDTGLSIDNWTLTVPFEIMGQSSAQSYWEKVLDSAGDAVKEFDVTMDLIFYEMSASTIALAFKEALDGKLVQNGIDYWFNSLPDATKAGAEWLESFLSIQTIEALTPNFTGSLFGWLTSQDSAYSLKAIDYLVDAFTTDQFDPEELFSYVTNNVSGIDEFTDIFSALNVSPETITASLRAQTAESIDVSVDNFLSSFMKALYLPGDAFIGSSAKLEHIKSTIFEFDQNDVYTLRSEYSDLTVHSTKDLLSHKDNDSLEGYAFRYAVENLNAFSITSVSQGLFGYGSSYVGVYEGYEASNFSDEYLDRRFEMLGYADKSGIGDSYDGNTSSGEDTVFKDFETNFTATLNDNLFDFFDPRHVIFGSEYSDIIYGENKADFLFGRDGNDIIYGGAGDDYIEGGDGVDMLYGGAGVDTYHFNAGDADKYSLYKYTTIFDTDAGNILSFGEGIDEQSFQYYDYGGSSLVIEYTANGIDQSIILHDWKYNQDMIAGISVDGSDPNDNPSTIGDNVEQTSAIRDSGDQYWQWSGSSGGDVLIFDPNLFQDHEDPQNNIWVGQDYLIAGFGGNDTLKGITVSGGSGNDHIEFYDPYNISDGGTLYGGSGSDTIIGGDGDDYISTFGNTLNANMWTVMELLDEFNEGVEERAQDNDPDNDDEVFNLKDYYLHQTGSPSSDPYNVGHGIGDVNNVYSGDGNDFIYGGLSDDFYHFSPGELTDTISDLGGNNALTFDYNFADIEVVGYNGVIYFYQGNDFLELIDPYSVFEDINSNGYLNSFMIKDPLNSNQISTAKDIESGKFKLVFNDGEYTLSDLQAKAFNFVGTENDDTVVMGYDWGESIYANGQTKNIDTGDGNDTIYYSGTNAVINAGDGDDSITLNQNADSQVTLILGANDGHDTVNFTGYKAPPLNIVQFENDGEDTVTAESVTLETKVTPEGQTQWTLHYNQNNSITFNASQTSVFNIILPTGFLLPMFSIPEIVNLADGGDQDSTRSTGGTTFVAGSGSDNIYDYFGNETTYKFTLDNGQNFIHESTDTQDAIAFYGDVSEQDLVFSSENDDLVIEYSEFDSVTIKDWYMGSEHHVESISFASGGSIDYAQLMTIADSFAPPATEITGTEFDDYLDGTFEDDILVGLAGNDYLWGYDGDDILIGGTGDDQLYGDWGDDTYIFNTGDGFDTIYESQGNDTIEFTVGISDVDVSFTRFYGDLSIHYSPTDTVVVSGWYFSPDQQIENIVFDDGTIWDEAYLASVTSNLTDEASVPQIITGTEFDDTLYGGFGDDEITGLAGNDYIEVPDGNNIINAGQGDDFVWGGYGNDTYILNQGDGHDFYFDPGGADTLAFGSGIADTDIVFDRMGFDLYVGYGTNDSVMIQDWYASTFNQIETFTFNDGTIWDQSTLQSMTDNLLDSTAINGTGGDDILTGSMGDDIINGFDGNDTLNGVDGYNTLIGGTGNDTLNGGALDDVYVFQAGDGQDTINDPGGWDTVVFDDETLSLADLIIDVNGDDLLFDYTDTGDNITVTDGYANQTVNIENVFFQNGESLFQEDIQQLANQAELNNAA